jgi:hypothetical protein
MVSGKWLMPETQKARAGGGMCAESHREIYGNGSGINARAGAGIEARIFLREGAHKTLRRDGRLWANGDEMYLLNNSDYNYWTPNGYGTSEQADNPAIGSLPVIDTDQLTKNTQIFPASGIREQPEGNNIYQGFGGYFWPNTPATSIGVYDLLFDVVNAIPTRNAAANNRGLSIRCVRI